MPFTEVSGFTSHMLRPDINLSRYLSPVSLLGLGILEIQWLAHVGMILCWQSGTVMTRLLKANAGDGVINTLSPGSLEIQTLWQVLHNSDFGRQSPLLSIEIEF